MKLKRESLLHLVSIPADYLLGGAVDVRPCNSPDRRKLPQFRAYKRAISTFQVSTLRCCVYAMKELYQEEEEFD